MLHHDRPVAVRWTAGTTLLVWLMVVWTLIDMALLVASRDHLSWRYLVLPPIVLAQFATLAGWLALGDGSLFGRFICVVAAVVMSELAVQLDTSHDARRNFAEVGAVAASIILTLSLPMFIATAIGWRCRHNDEIRSDERPFQFRIAHVFVLTGAVGAMLGLWRALPERLTGMTVMSAAVALFLSPGIVTQWFLQLRPRLGLVWFVALLVAAGYGLTAVVLFYLHEPLSNAALALYTLALGVNLALFRGGGYRLLRRIEQESHV